jgi:hypothetical protein
LKGAPETTGFGLLWQFAGRKSPEKAIFGDFMREAKRDKLLGENPRLSCYYSNRAL